MDDFLKFLTIIIILGIVSGIIFGVIEGESFDEIYTFDNYPENLLIAVFFRFITACFIFFIGFSVLGFLFIAPILFYRAYSLAIEAVLFLAISPSWNLLYSLFLPTVLELLALLIISTQALVFSVKLLHSENEKLSHRTITYIIGSFIFMPFLFLSALCDLFF